ncbi:MAG: MoaD/ThiS family protein [Deltaproteobacteria bacterium]|nr:MoaD/ThiS family protein [Deltaproteobacteria bacterium]
MTKVLFFAATAAATGIAEETLPFEGESVSAAKEALGLRHEKLLPILPHCRVALNQAFVSDEEVIPEGAEFALIPPVAGG